MMSMNEFVIYHESTIRLGFFFGTFASIALWEPITPKRVLSVSKPIRRLNNLGLVALNTFLLRLLFPTATVGCAAFASMHGWGLLNYYHLPSAISFVGSIVFLNFINYLQHVLVHAVPALWRLHRVHHADLDYDVTTGGHFHPIEIIFSMLIKFAVIATLGPPVVAVVIFEVLLNVMTMFNHGNFHLPQKVDRVLRWLVVTPDMHRVHHSVEDDETNSDFGFNLPWWDRLFGTYRKQPRKGHQDMSIGINHYRDPEQVEQLYGMLALPFKGKIFNDVINRRKRSYENDS